MDTIQQQMVETMKNERTGALNEINRLSNQLGFTAGILKGSLTKDRKKS